MEVPQFAKDDVKVKIMTKIPVSGWSYDESKRSLVENDYRLRSVYDHRVTDCLSKHPPLYLSDQEKDETAT